MTITIADDDSTTKRRRGLVGVLIASIGLLTAVMVAAGCSLPITEPPDFPGAIRNFLDEPVEIYEDSSGNADEPVFVVRMDPGELYELPSAGDLCRDQALVALGDGGELGRQEARCDIDIGRVWVLHAEGNYVMDYYGDETDYWRD